ncbi:MAG: hypothetical protein FJY75_11935 [Candidatus Eisenbacteria bacterium]|uniref:Peptidase C-terminal archaeal/bacterial domain-containing protein n=1 Tax=Eiseniibacteriota bacterium TaxID=2212470 RepID=A0A937XDP7_UNCEI|nr:hypothetical protein [Candidatus Eisenbacteria bacterium]
MRTLVLICLVSWLSAASADDGLSVANAGPVMPPKPAVDGAPPPPPPEEPRIQGDTVADPFIIPALPFSAAGSTCGFINDYDAVCPYTGSTSPDVVYKYVPATTTYVSIDLCNSTYDTKVYVFENTVGSVIACNDDYCEWQSYLADVPMTPGNTYYIVVDGYGGSCGYYSLELWIISGGCYIECPAGSMPEGEPVCYPNYLDTYNPGCNGVPPLFQVLEPGCGDIVICGTTGVYLFGTTLYRDTDWFELDLTEPSQICLAGDAEVPAYFFIIDGRYGCEGLAIVASATAGPCIVMSGLCHYCDAGTWWTWAGPVGWDHTYWCGSQYYMEIAGYTGGSSPALGTTWGSVKGLFR